MPKQTIKTEVEDISTDTYDKLTAVITFEVDGRRNVPSLEHMGMASDKATWLFQKLLEALYETDRAKREAKLASTHDETRKILATVSPQPTPPAVTPVPAVTPNA